MEEIVNINWFYDSIILLLTIDGNTSDNKAFCNRSWEDTLPGTNYPPDSIKVGDVEHKVTG